MCQYKARRSRGQRSCREALHGVNSRAVPYHIYQGVPLSSPITRHLDKQQSAQALIIAGLGLQSLTHQPTGDNERKTRLDNLNTNFVDYGIERIPVCTSQRSPWLGPSNDLFRVKPCVIVSTRNRDIHRHSEDMRATMARVPLHSPNHWVV